MTEPQDNSDEGWNWLREGHDPYIEQRAKHDEEYAELIKLHYPDLYASWDWTD
ncbi:hypothetical protein ACFQGT_09650 [Natrialbaceae archaeon GCM10025810]|uniref:hypothetical protein n=1 Tax=Halovalidus salilacus TaxID=3075124 RepID=UPI00360EB7F6